MAVPVRITDNNKCLASGGNADTVSPYCYMDFSDYPTTMADILTEVPALPNTDATFCLDMITWTTENGGSQDICVTETDQVLIGRVAATRPRIGMHGYDSDGDGINDSAWVILGYEETKALGEGTTGDPEEIIDDGKNLWYHSFDMKNPDIVSHGNILNQPAKDPSTYNSSIETASYFDLKYISDSEYDLDLGEYSYWFYETEIARRFSLISQDFADAGDSGAVAFTLIKQGIIKQGGPADIFGRTFAVTEEICEDREDPANCFDPATENPYTFENMVCESWNYNEKAVPDGDTITNDYNPYYPKGICLDDPVNLSGTKAVDCEDGSCPELTDVYTCDTDGVFEWDTGAFERVTQWSMCGPNYDGTFTSGDF